MTDKKAVKKNIKKQPKILKHLFIKPPKRYIYIKKI